MTKKNQNNIEDVKVASIKEFVKFYAPQEDEIVYDINGKKLTVMINPIVTYGEVAGVIESVSDAAFKSDKYDISDYQPEFASFIKKCSIITLFSDFKLPKDINQAWAVIFYTPLYDDIMKKLGSGTIDIMICINKCIDNLVKAHLNYACHKTDINRILDSLMETLKDIGIGLDKDELARLKELGTKVISDNMPGIENLDEENKGENTTIGD